MCRATLCNLISMRLILWIPFWYFIILFMRSADTLSGLDGDMWIHLGSLPLLEIDQCHCACGPLSCFKLPAWLCFSRDLNFLFACVTCSWCLSPVWWLLVSLLWNIYHILILFFLFASSLDFRTWLRSVFFCDALALCGAILLHIWEGSFPQKIEVLTLTLTPNPKPNPYWHILASLRVYWSVILQHNITRSHQTSIQM